jgi:hypothetical protein
MGGERRRRRQRGTYEDAYDPEFEDGKGGGEDGEPAHDCDWNEGR